VAIRDQAGIAAAAMISASVATEVGLIAAHTSWQLASVITGIILVIGVGLLAWPKRWLRRPPAAPHEPPALHEAGVAVPGWTPPSQR
jgi:hypothetical protein